MTSSRRHVTRLLVAAALLMTSSHGGRGRATFRVDEELPAGRVVGSVADLVTSRGATATSEMTSEGDDGGGARGFSLLAVRAGDLADDDSAARGLFSVESESGVVRTAAVIDREALCPAARRRRPTPSCVVSLDLAILPRFDVVTVDVEILDANDHAPAFGANATTRHVTESAAPFGPIFPLPVAVDPDAGDNGAVEYRLLPTASPFRLVVDAGADELTVELVEPLDRETTYVQQHYCCYSQAEKLG